MQSFITVAKCSDVPTNGVLQLEVAGRKVVLCEMDGDYFALEAVCPHKGGPLGACPPEHGSLFCPLHGWEFDVRTGACKTRPDKFAKCYPVRVAGDEIQIAVHE